jgi:phosphohistidine phosphatase
MKLYIVRHGIAIDREDPRCPSEAERYLTEEGIAKTRQVAERIAAIAGANLMISSPYVRASQTAEIFAAAMKYAKGKILKTELLLPGSDPLVFYRELAHHKNRSSVFCFGHAPHLDELVAAGLGLKKDVTQLKKAGVALLELHRISPPAGTLVWLAAPKLLGVRSS